MKPKIAYVVTDYTNSGGIERVLSNKANYFVNLDYDILIITFAHNREKKPFFHFDDRIKFYELYLPLSEYKLNSKRMRGLFAEKLRELLEEIKPDITVGIGLDLGFYTYLSKDGSVKILESHFSKYKRKLKMIEMDKWLLTRFIPFIYYYKQTRLVKQYDRFVVLTEEDKESWKGVDNIAVIPNSLSFVPKEKSKVISKNIIAIGRFATQKGFDKLLKIWKDVSPHFPDWHLNIYGSGTNRKKKKLEDYIAKHNLSNTTELKAPTSNIVEEFLNSSIYAMTSRYEGLPMVLIEAMACGVPPVSYACKCGPRDVIKDQEDGFLVDVNDKNTFIERLSQLMENENLRKKMGQAASENILRLSEDKVMKQWIELFDELTKR